MWATIWSISKAENINTIFAKAKENGFNQVFLQVRYRADALYITNKNDSTYPNNEQRCYVLKESNFDPLQYAIKKSKEYNIEIHAWVPIFILTPHDLRKINNKHPYYKHRNWITYNKDGKPMAHDKTEGAFLDPGIPEVQSYLLNVLQDIAINYDVDGIHFDYIRYPDSIYGYNPLALKEFKKSSTTDFNNWKREQINSFVNKAFILIKNINPKIKITAAVFANQHKAINILSQDWKTWITNSYIDHIYVMAYNTSNVSFQKVLIGIEDVRRDKTTIILRAWADKKPYNVRHINSKINLSKRYGFYNFGFYSYAGLTKNRYFKRIKY